MPELADRAARDRATLNLDESLLVEASAGTGKTRTIVDRVLSLLTTPITDAVTGARRPLRLTEIAAITFTERAAQELKDRVRSSIFARLARTAPGDPDAMYLRRAIEDAEQASIGTIHGLCARMLRTYPILAGVDIQFDVADPGVAREIIADTWEEWITRELGRTQPPPALSRTLALGVSVATLERLAVLLADSRAWDVATVAAHMTSPPADREGFQARLDEVIEAYSLPDRDRMAEWGIARKPNAASVERLRQLKARLTDADDGAAERIALETLEFENSKYFAPLSVGLERLRDATCAPLLRELVEWLAGTGPGGSFLDAYRSAKLSRGVLDYDDLLLRARDLVRDDETARSALRDTYRSFIVDEFQDTDRVQAELVVTLTATPESAGDWRSASIQPGRLCIVGDPKQSIYRFRGANIETYSRIGDLLGRESVCRLKTNFRSHPAIVDAVNAIFEAPNAFDHPDDADGEQSAYQPDYARLEARPDFPDTPGRPRVMRVTGESPTDGIGDARRFEADAVVRAIRQMRDEGWLVRDMESGDERPVRYGDIAILYRTANHLDDLESAFRNAGIPHYQTGGRNLSRREEIVRLVSVLNAVEQPSDALSVVAGLRSPFFGVPDNDLAEAAISGSRFDFRRREEWGALPISVRDAFEVLEALHEQRRDSRPSEVVRALYDMTGVLGTYALTPNGDQAVANLLMVLDEARHLEEDPPATFRGLLDHLRAMDQDGAGGNEASFDAGGEEGWVHLLTIHRAKGLEFPVVFVVDLAAEAGRRGSEASLTNVQSSAHGPPDVALSLTGDGNRIRTPGAAQVTAADRARDEAESVRLLYVAVTRARDYLLLPRVMEIDSAGRWEQLVQDAAQRREWFEFEPATTPPAADGTPGREPMETLNGDLDNFLKTRDEASHRGIERRITYQAPSLHENERAAPEETTPPVEACESPDQDIARRIGTAVHRALELLPFNAQDVDVSRVVASLAKEGRLDNDSAEYVATLARRGLRMDVVQRAAASEQVWREAPVTAWGTDGSEIETVTRGFCDLVFLDGDDLILVDYKTDRLDSEPDDHELGSRAEHYEKQIDDYVGAIQAATGRTVKEAWLVFLAAGEDGRQLRVRPRIVE